MDEKLARDFFVRRIISKFTSFYFVSVIALIVMFSVCKCIKPETCFAAPVKVVPVPENVFTLFNEIMAVRAEGKAGTLLKGTKIDLTPLLKQQPDLKEVLLLLYEDGRIKEKLEYKSKGRYIVANITAGKTYLIFKAPTGRILNTYKILCLINLYRVQIPPDLIDPICTKILCSQDSFSVRELLIKFSELNNLKNEIYNGIEEDAQIGGLGPPGVPGNICDHCTDFKQSGLIIPIQDCWNQPPVVFPANDCLHEQEWRFSAVDYWSQQVEPYLREIEPCVHYIHPDNKNIYAVSHWGADLLEEIAGQVRAIDLIGGNTGHIEGNNGQISTVPGVVRNAFDFYNNTNDRPRLVVDQNVAPGLDFENESFTLTAWINLAAGTPGDQIVIFKGTSTTNFGYKFYIDSSNKLGFSLKDTNLSPFNVVSLSSIPASTINNGFTHIAAVCSRSTNGDKLSLFIHDQEVGSSTFQSIGSLYRQGNFSIGGSDPNFANASGLKFNGLIDEVVVFKGALSSQDIADIKNTHNYWRKHLIDVTKFGVVGDGLADDTHAIQNVLDTVPSGAVVYFPRGTYLTSQPLQITRGSMHIVGDNAVIKAIGSMKTVININTNDAPLRLEGFTIDANHCAKNGLKAYKIPSRLGVIEHVTVLNAKEDGIWLDECQVSVLKYVSSLNNGEGGFYLRSCNGLYLAQTEAINNDCSGYIIDSNYIRDSTGVGTGTGSGCLWINGFSAVGNGEYGIYAKPGDKDYLVEGPVIRNGWIKDNVRDGVLMESIGSVVTNTVFSNTIHSDNENVYAIRLNVGTANRYGTQSGHRIFDNRFYSPTSSKYLNINIANNTPMSMSMPMLVTSDTGQGSNIFKRNSKIDKPLAPPPPLPPIKIIECNNVLNVRDYGAIGDGQTDDTEALKSAISSALTAGKEVFFPPGIYRITDHLCVNGSVVIHGEGATILAGTSTSSIIDLKNVAIKLQGLVLDGNKMARNGITADSIQPNSHFQYLTIKNVKGDNTGTAFFLKNSDNAVIEHVALREIGTPLQESKGFCCEDNTNLTLNFTEDTVGTGTGYRITTSGGTVTAFRVETKSGDGVIINQSGMTLCDGWLESISQNPAPHVLQSPVLIKSPNCSVSGARILSGGENIPENDTFPILLENNATGNHIYANQFAGGHDANRRVGYPNVLATPTPAPPPQGTTFELNVKSIVKHYEKADPSPSPTP